MERLHICIKNDCRALDDFHDATKVLTLSTGLAAVADEHGGDDAADPAAAPTVAAAAAA